MLKDRLRVFAFSGFARFARKFNISNEALWNVVQSHPDADLGGGLYKYRLARPGEGSRGGGRALIALKFGAARSSHVWVGKERHGEHQAQ